MERIKNINKKIRLKLFSMQNPKVAVLVKKVTDEHMSYLGKDALWELALIAITNEKKHLKGIIVEVGCALGGSAIVLASAKNKSRDLFVYDVFGKIPPPSERDKEDVHERYEIIESGRSKGIGGKRYYGYEENLYDKVLEEFSNSGIEVKENNVHLIKGLFEDTLTIEQPVSLAHIDCDWHDSVLTCLNRIEPCVVKNGTLVIDDYYVWSGCREAVDKYFENKSGYEFIKKSRLHIIKK